MDNFGIIKLEKVLSFLYRVPINDKVIIFTQTSLKRRIRLLHSFWTMNQINKDPQADVEMKLNSEDETWESIKSGVKGTNGEI